MRIDSVHIYGFGKWQDQQFSFPDSNEIIKIIGNNESGKSTLRQFILYMLFGEKLAKLKYYIPKKGTVLGGRMTVSGLSSKVVTIERVDGKNKNNAQVSVAGERKDEDWLQEQLKGIDRAQYEAIFSFDAIDLQQIQHVDNQAIHEVLIAIGMSGSDRIYQAEKKLDKNITELFKPYGKKPEINQLFQELIELKERLVKAKQEEATYRVQLEEMGILESNLDNEIIAKQHVVADLQQLEKRSAHYQLIEDYYLASTNLKRLPSGLAFPTDGIERFNQWKEQLLPLQSEQRIIEKNMKEVEQGLNTLSLLSDEERKQLEYVIDLREEMKYLNEKQEGAANKLAEIRKEITDKLLSIQINLTFDELEEISLPFYLEELWTELSKKIEKIELEQRYVENDQASNQNIMNDFEQQIQHESEQLIDSSIIANYKQELVEADLTREQENQQLRFQKWQKQYRQQSKSSMIIFMVGLLISIGFLFLTDWMWGGIIAFLSFLQYVVMRIYGQVMKKWLAPVQAKSIRLSEKERVEKKQQIEKNEKQKERINSLEKNLQHHRSEQLKLEARTTFLMEQLEQIDIKIRDQQTQFPFLKMVDIAYWAKLYQQLMMQKERLTVFQQIKADLTKLDQIKQQKERELTALPIDLDQNLAEVLQIETDKHNEAIRLADRLKDLSYQLDQCREKQQPYLNEINQLMAHAQVEMEEQFIKKGEQFNQIAATAHKVNQLHDSLSVIFEEQTIIDFANGQFSDKNTLNIHMKESKKKLEKSEKAINQLQKNLSDRKAAIELLESKEEVSIINHQLSLKQEKLSELARKWAIQQIAQSKLIKAKTSYSEKYMPMIFEKASSYFNRLTIERYPSIYIEDNKNILVEDKEGFQYDVAELSQATKDQLYIALRFSLSHVMADRFAFPFLIDDGFVHFDAGRKERVLELLEEISQQHQVFYFTANKTETAKIVL